MIFPNIYKLQICNCSDPHNSHMQKQMNYRSLLILQKELDLFDFGTDAIERMRIAPSMLDDFEYGLQLRSGLLE